MSLRCDYRAVELNLKTLTWFLIPVYQYLVPCASIFGSFIIPGFPDSSVGKESACSAGHPGSIPGLGRCPEEGIGYPLQDFRVSREAQTGKNPPAMQETPVLLLGQEDPLKKG